jgi:sugar (pentulose or hexulose) kinase
MFLGLDIGTLSVKAVLLQSAGALQELTTPNAHGCNAVSMLKFAGPR